MYSLALKLYIHQKYKKLVYGRDVPWCAVYPSGGLYQPLITSGVDDN